MPDDVPFFEGDIADRALVDRILKEHGIGAIMHFAGSIVVPELVEKPLDYYRNNTLASTPAQRSGCGRREALPLLLDCRGLWSARSVPIAEDDSKVPINPYGASKLMTERMLEDASAAYPFNYGALRYFNVAGADPDGRRASSAAGRPTSSRSPSKLRSASGPMWPSTAAIIQHPDGTCIRDYIHVSDLASAHVAALDG